MQIMYQVFVCPWSPSWKLLPVVLLSKSWKYILFINFCASMYLIRYYFPLLKLQIYFIVLQWAFIILPQGVHTKKLNSVNFMILATVYHSVVLVVKIFSPEGVERTLMQLSCKDKLTDHPFFSIKSIMCSKFHQYPFSWSTLLSHYSSTILI